MPKKYRHYTIKKNGSKLLPQLLKWGFSFTKWYISRASYITLYRFAKKNENQLFFPDLVIDRIMDFLSHTPDIQLKNGMPIGKIPPFDISNIDNESRFYYNWCTDSPCATRKFTIKKQIEILIKPLNNFYCWHIEKNMPILCSDRPTDHYNNIFGYRLENNKLVKYTTLNYCKMLSGSDNEDIDYSSIDHWESCNSRELYSKYKYGAETWQVFKNNKYFGILPIYPDVRRKCFDIYSIRYLFKFTSNELTYNILPPEKIYQQHPLY